MLRKFFLILLLAPGLLLGFPPTKNPDSGNKSKGETVSLPTQKQAPVQATIIQKDPGDGDGGGTGGTGGTATPPAYDITTSPGYPWGPNPATPSDVLLENQSLGVNQSLVSQNGSYRVILQGDGNLVIYNGSHPTWDSTTSGYWVGPTGRLTMQSDGNLVIYNSNYYPYWDIGKNPHFDPAAGRYGYYLKIQNDGNLVVYNRWGIDPNYFYAVYGYGLAMWDCHYSHGNRH